MFVILKLLINIITSALSHAQVNRINHITHTSHVLISQFNSHLFNSNSVVFENINKILNTYLHPSLPSYSFPKSYSNKCLGIVHTFVPSARRKKFSL